MKVEITLNKENKIKIKVKKERDEVIIGLSLKSILKINEFKIDSFGEFEIKEIFVEGISIDKNLFYLLNINKTKVCFCANKIGQLKAEEIEKIGTVDILIINIEKYDNNKDLAQLILQIEPKTTIPIYSNIEKLDKFLQSKGLKLENSIFLDKLTLKSKDLEEGGGIILLNKV